MGSSKREDMEGQGSITSLLIHGRFTTPKWEYAHHVVPPMSSSTTYRLESAERGAQGFQELGDSSVLDSGQAPIYIYDRLDEPTRGMLEDRLAIAEDGECAVTFAAGMAAICAALCTSSQAGDKILSHKTIYGCTHSLLTVWLPRFGIDVEFVDFNDRSALEAAVDDRTRVLYFETPCNPTMTLIDIQQMASFAEQVNRRRSDDKKLLVIVDNTFATPYCQRPLQLGADMVVARRDRYHDLMLFRKDFGGVISTKAAWSIMVYGVSTLALRMKTQQENAQRVAQFLRHHPAIERVSYPGLPDFPQAELARQQMRDFGGEFAPGNMLYFVVKGAPDEALKRGRALINYLAQHAYSITLAVSLGQVRTLIEHPGSMTHAMIPPESQVEAEIDPGGIRLSLGVEDSEDLISDLGHALEQIT